MPSSTAIPPPLSLPPSRALILDGALATELERRGHVLNSRIWSAAALRDDPGAIRAVHAAYYAAGARVATTASYQAAVPGLLAMGLSGVEARRLVERSVGVAQEARRDEIERRKRVRELEAQRESEARSKSEAQSERQAQSERESRSQSQAQSERESQSESQAQMGREAQSKRTRESEAQSKRERLGAGAKADFDGKGAREGDADAHTVRKEGKREDAQSKGGGPGDRESEREGDENQRLLIAGSVGPYGAFLADGSEYTGRYALGREALKAFHRERIGALVGAGADLLALETMPNRAEIEALLELLGQEFPAARAWVSVTVRQRGDILQGGDGDVVGWGGAGRQDGDGHDNGDSTDGENDEILLSDGTCLTGLAKVVDASPQILAIGVNCIPQALVTASLQKLACGTDKPLLCYPNSGEAWDAVNKVWIGDRTEEHGLEDRVREWWAVGARWFGGCCRMGPEDIEIIKRTVEEEEAKLQQPL